MDRLNETDGSGAIDASSTAGAESTFLKGMFINLLKFS